MGESVDMGAATVVEAAPESNQFLFGLTTSALTVPTQRAASRSFACTSIKSAGTGARRSSAAPVTG